MFLLKNVKSIRLISTSAIYNAGHSKWANIKHDKAIKDQQKSFLFEKLGRQIRLAILGNYIHIFSAKVHFRGSAAGTKY